MSHFPVVVGFHVSHILELLYIGDVGAERLCAYLRFLDIISTSRK